MTIADVAFDAPVHHSFSYRVPDGWTVVPGQRAQAPLGGAGRVGMVVAVRDGAEPGLKPLAQLVDAEPVLSRAQLALVDWIAAQSLSSVGSTCAALLPPPAGREAAGSAGLAASGAVGPGAPKPELLTGAGREKRVLERLEATKGAALVIAADVETVARWAQRLAKIDRAVRLDSGVPDEERGAAWRALRDGSARLAAGTRSALLAPLPPPATLVLLDEHEAAHKPPGAPRMHSRAAARLVCRVCGASHPLPDTCAACHGRRLTPFGWGAERVEHAVRRRFSDARIARWDPDAARGARGEAQRAAAAAADVVIGTRGALRLFGPAALGLAAFVAPDQLLRAPDFRAGERTLAPAWAAAERVAADGAVIIPSQNPGHYAFAAVARQNLHEFYGPELKFRAELGYPPFRRLAVVTTRGADAAETRRLAEAVGAALRGAKGLTVYPPVPDRSDRTRRIVAKGDPDLPRRLDEALREFKSTTAGRGMIDVEVDPVEWPS